MKKKDDRPGDADPSTELTGSPHAGSGQALRRQAEEIAREKAARMTENLEVLSPEEIRRTLHELRVHQIELEMQNEELRRAQAELDTSRARYFDLYDLAPVGYCTLSEKGLILETNLTAATLLGMARGALIKQPLTQFILKEDQIIYYQHRKRLFETQSKSSGQAGEPQACELRMVRKDGPAFWAHLEATAARDAGGAPVCHVVMSDITERKQVAALLQQAHDELEQRVVVRTEELRQANEELQADITDRKRAEAKLKEVYDIISRSPVVAFLWKNAGGWPVEFVTDNVELLFGYKAGELTSGEVPYSGTVHPDDLERVAKEVADHSKEKGRIAFDHEPYRIVTKDGKTKWVNDNTFIRRNEKGEITHYQGILSDITDHKQAEEKLKESEEKYRSLAASVDSMYLVDRDCIYLFMNEGHRKRFGLPLEKLIGRRYGEFHFEEDEKEFADCIREVCETGKPIIKEHRSERGGRYFLRTFTPIKGPSPVGEISKVVIVSKDITKRKEAEKDLIKTVQQLQETRDMLIQFEKEAAVGRLAVGVAHELLNPASIISSRLQFMEDETLTDQARESVRICREQLQRIVKISQDLHRSSAIQPRPHVSGDLRNVIELSLKITESRMREDQVCVVYHPPPAIIPVKMERDGMSKVMVHLILNAWDALLNTEQKRLIITVQYPIATDKPSSVLLIVADNGCGLSEEDRNRIFDPFFTTKDPGKGTGLGLSVSRGIIQEHGGTIKAENNDMGGASFIIELPLDRP